jgi:hypothetical protein
MPREVKVRCGPELHTIAVNAKGQLVCRDHSRAFLRREYDFVMVGGYRRRCSQVIHSFGRAVSEGREHLAALPKVLRQAASGLRRLRSREGPSRALQREQVLSRRTWWERPEGVQRLLDHVLHGQLGVPADVRALVADSPGDGAYRLTLASPGALLERWVETDWLRLVYQSGLAVLHGALTLTIVDPRGRWLWFPESGAVAVQARPQVAPDGSVVFVDQLVRLRRRPGGGGFEGVPVRQRRRRG